ncbi:MAG: sodium:proton antiporter NhaD [Saprospiraceae bacterium]|nr:sodium:proton antiporter NhaD [Saprospiraceae bacterium]
MITALVLCFVIGYSLIVFEHPLRLDKSVPALLMGSLCWAMISMGHLDVITHEHTVGEIEPVLLHHIGKIAKILLFLIGAMTIVELIDLHRGFSVITDRISTTKKTSMLWIILILAFFMSAVLDNLASTIVLVSLLRKLVPQREERLWFVSMAVIGANAGGAWSPIGDVTTTMLWIGKRVSSLGLIEHIVIPSLICIIIPGIIAMFLPAFRGNITPKTSEVKQAGEKPLKTSKWILFAGLGGLIFVPVFKSITHLPPYIGIMLSLGIVWLISEYIHPGEDFSREEKEVLSARHALSRIEMSSIIFFLGILAAVAALESAAVMGHGGHMIGLLNYAAEGLDAAIPNIDIVVIVLGFFSAIIDNVPLVAASMGMYNFPMDDRLWHFIAYSAGTGGSMLIIGSAAGVAAMGMERIDFIWYLKNISWIAALGFLGGAGAFIVLSMFF